MNRISALTSIALTLLILSMAELAFANPLAAPMVSVESPINNQIYPTGNVELKTGTFPGINFTINYYVLDDQTPVTTNGTAVLSNLSPGSHTLTLYGTFSDTNQYTNSTYQQSDELASIVYFSVIYSTPWVIFTVILALVLAIPCSVLFWKRRQIKSALERPKRDVFFVGAVLLFFSSIASVFFGWQISNFYLFPYWPRGLVFVPILPFIISVFFFFLGLILTRFGVHKKLDPPMPTTV